MSTSGMRCPHCGGQTEIKETRRALLGYVMKRKRVCFNMHGFFTYEINGAVWHSIRKAAEINAASAEKNSEMYARNVRMIRDIKNGKLAKEVATENGLARNTVSYILKKFGLHGRRKHAPEFSISAPIVEDRKAMRERKLETANEESRNI